MPRQIDLQCPKCGFVEEVQKEITFFEDEEPEQNPCPNCEYAYRMELPPLVSIHLQQQKDPPAVPKKPPKLSPDGVMPEDIRRAFAKELFDPCSCGDHAPADLDEHEADCHVRQHTFMNKKNQEQESLGER